MADSLDEAIHIANRLYEDGGIDIMGDEEMDPNNTKEDEYFKDHLDMLDTIYDTKKYKN